MPNKSLHNNNLKNVMLSSFDILDTFEALNTLQSVRSNDIDTNWGTPTDGKIALDQSVTGGNRTLTIPEDSTGTQAIRYVRARNFNDSAIRVRLELPQNEPYEFGGELIITKLEGTLIDKEVID